MQRSQRVLFKFGPLAATILQPVQSSFGSKPNARRDRFPCEVRADSSGRLATVPGKHRDASPPNNLPLQLSTFVGRGKELAEAGRLLEDTRLLTLTGSGGCGKTRLALAAGELAEGFEDGVWLVELAPLEDLSLVPQAVASVLGVHEQPGHPLTDLGGSRDPRPGTLPGAATSHG
jgi:hypothetical protein